MEGLLDDGFGVSGLNMYFEGSNSEKTNSKTIFETNNR